MTLIENLPFFNLFHITLSSSSPHTLLPCNLIRKRSIISTSQSFRSPDKSFDRFQTFGTDASFEATIANREWKVVHNGL